MSALDPRAEHLHECLDRIAAGEPVDDVLADIADAELARLVLLGANVAEVAPVKAPPAFRARLQTQLQDELAAQPARPSLRAGFWRLWLARGAAVLVAVAMVVSSAVAASADSIPGERLYGLKLVVEDARLAATLDPERRVRLRMTFVGVRLAEIERLIDRGIPLDASVVEALLAAQRAAEAEAESTGDDDLVDLAIEQGSEHGQSLARLVDRVDPAAQASVRDAANALDDSDERVPSSAEPAALETAAATDAPAAQPATASPNVPGPTDPTPENAVPSSTVPAEIASPMPIEPTRVPATPPPATERPPGPPTSEPTDVEPTMVAETPKPPEQPTQLPTLERGDQRLQTQTAEARPKATRAPPHRRPPQHGNVEPTRVSPPATQPHPGGH